MSRADRASRAVLEGIASGRYPVGAELPAEAELAEAVGVSRLTAREAIRDLAGRGVVRVRHGKRGVVADPSGWDLLDADLMRLRGTLLGESHRLALQLMELRRITEIGAAELAATRIGDSQLTVLEETLEQMRAAEQTADVPLSVAADLRFHQLIVEATGNEFLAASYRPLSEVLQEVRMKTSASESVRRDAIRWHAEILTALRGHDVAAAVAAMRGHMDQTAEAIDTLMEEEA